MYCLINSKPFCDEPVKKAYKYLIETKRNDNYTTRILIDILNHEIYYNLVRINLLRQKNITILQQIHFTENLEENDGETNFFVSKEQQKIF